MILLGICLLSFGLSTAGSMLFYVGFNPIGIFLAALSMLVALVGVIVLVIGIMRSIQQGKNTRVVNEQKKLSGQGVCTKCGLNISAECTQCPRCGEFLNRQ